MTDTITLTLTLYEAQELLDVLRNAHFTHRPNIDDGFVVAVYCKLDTAIGDALAPLDAVAAILAAATADPYILEQAYAQDDANADDVENV